MTRDLLKVLDRYYLRYYGKQIPVEFVGFQHVGEGPARLDFRRLDNGDMIYKRYASALSKHRDNCAFFSRRECGCDKDLSRLGGAP